LQSEDQRSAFALFDKKGDEKISVNDVGMLLRSLGQNPSEASVKKIQGELGGVDNRITFEDFLPILKNGEGSKPSGSQAQFVDGLNVFGSKDGGISAAELRHVLTSLGEKLTDEDVDQLLRKMDVESDGTVNVEQFVKMVMA